MIMCDTVMGLKVNYRDNGSGTPTLLLHGWGVDSSTLAGVEKYLLAQGQRVLILDLPGFGGTEAPPEVWGVYEYADFVAEFLRWRGVEKPQLLGHSFGGRLSIILGSRGVARRIVLCDSAGIIPKRSFRYHLRVKSYKLAKKIFALPGLKLFREQALSLWVKNNPSSDYAATEGVMRGIFVKVVNQDLQPLLSDIKVPTLLIWGENDTATPLADGQLMEKLIPDAGLAVFEGCGHYPFLEQPARFNSVLSYFLKNNE